MQAVDPFEACEIAESGIAKQIDMADVANEMTKIIRKHDRRARWHRRRVRWAKAFFRMIGRRADAGVTRLVVHGRHTVIKVPRFDNGLDHFLMGWLGNRTERSKWYAASVLYQPNGMEDILPWQMLAPIRRSYFFGLIIVMDRCRPVTREQYNNFTLDIDLPLWEYYFSDFHQNNFGWLHGRIVCLDYAD